MEHEEHADDTVDGTARSDCAPARYDQVGERRNDGEACVARQVTEGSDSRAHRIAEDPEEGHVAEQMQDMSVEKNVTDDPWPQAMQNKGVVAAAFEEADTRRQEE